MGSGDKFRFDRMHPGIFALGVSVGRRMEHEWSIAVELLIWRLYIGIGKGYEEFDR